MTTEELYAIKPDKYGWRKLPNGNNVSLGDDVRLGNNVSLGDYVRLGNNVSLGDDVSLGNNVRLGDDVSLGDYVRLGDDVRLGNNVILERQPLQIIGSRHVVVLLPGQIVAIGCNCLPLRYWLENYREMGEDAGYSEAEIEEYKGYLDLVAVATGRLE